MPENQIFKVKRFLGIVPGLEKITRLGVIPVGDL